MNADRHTRGTISTIVALLAIVCCSASCSDSAGSSTSTELDGADSGPSVEAGASDASDANDGSPSPDAGEPSLTPADHALACFDSYCPGRALAKIPITPWSQKGTAPFMNAFGEQLNGPDGFLTRINNIYDSDVSHGSDWEWDYYNRVVQKQAWEPQLIMSKVGLECHRAYEAHKQGLAQAGQPAPDPTTLDWKTLPKCKAAGQWLEKIYDAWFQYQIMTHDIQPAQGGAVPNDWDPYGMWKYGTTFSPVRQWFEGSGYFYVYARYAHLLDAAFLESTRPRIMAALCGLQVGSSNVGTYDFESFAAAQAGAQWLLKTDSWVQMTTALLRTEAALGIGPSSTDCSGAGTFSSVEALATTEQLTANTRQYVEQGGHNEFNSSYGHVILDSLVQMMTTPSSQKVYDDIAPVYRALLWDIAANFSPSAGTPTGPSNRNFDLLMGSHNLWMNYEVPMFIQPFFHPYCDDLGTCLPNTPDDPIPPASATSALPYFRSFFAMWQLAGFSFFPYQDVSTLTIDSAIRTNVQRAGFTQGMDRQHFVCPHYSIGNAGDDTYLLADNYRLTARLGGSPNPEYPVTPDAVVNQNPNTFAVGEIRHMLASQDDPFVTTPEDNRPGMFAQLTPRQVAAQHQSWMLVTQLAVPGQSGGTSYGSFDLPLSSNLLFPLAVDEIYADHQPLPRELGSATVVPMDTVFTLRHGDAAIVIRTLVFEHSPSSKLLVAAQLAPTTVVSPGSASYQHAIQWQVDASGHKVGYGKVVFTHKAASDQVNRPYHVAWLWAGGITRTDAEMSALQELVRSAPITVNAFESSGKWDLANNIFTGGFEGTDPVGSSTWTIEVNVAGHLLRVSREDVYSPWGNDPQYRQWDSTFPFYTIFDRTWDSRPTMPAKNWASAEVDAFVQQTQASQLNEAYLTVPHTDSEFFQPHLSAP